MRSSALLFLLFLPACPGATPRCEVGTRVACTCLEGTSGTQVCKADGTLERCEPCKTMCGRTDCAVATLNADGRGCVAEQCDYTSCVEGYSDCDGVRANGCEYLGFSCPVRLASGQEQVASLAVDERSVYWTTLPPDGGRGFVRRMSAEGGASVTLASDQLKPIGLVVDRTSVYWTALNSLMKVGLDGGTPVALASGQDLMSGWLALDSSAVYWTVDQIDHALRKVALDGGTVIDLASGQYPGSLAVDGTSVYWTDSIYKQVNRLPLAGGTFVTLATPSASPNNIATDGVNVYWFTYSELLKAPVDGGASVLLASAKVSGLGLVVDQGFLYWADLGGSIMRVPVDGGTPSTVASNQNDPYGVAVDQSSVYWTNYPHDTIWKARKGP